MNRDRYQQVKSLFLEARGVPAPERTILLRDACGEDGELLEQVESLLAEDVADLDPRRPADEIARDDPRVGGVIGPYRILEVIGEGGMGIVYRAEQRRPRRSVALKVIKSGLASPERLQRFEREADVLGRLQHPGIAQIYEAGTAHTADGLRPFFVMELVDGEPLTDHVEKRSLPDRARLELLLRVCDAVEHAHERSVVHRDLKPANILVDTYGNPKILDFGVARTMDGRAPDGLRTAAGQIIGTAPYLSPEQVSGDPSTVDASSDVYALGVVCYELLAGRPPFEVQGRTLLELLRMIADEEPASLGSIDRAYRGDLEAIVSRALEKDKSRRYGAVSEFAQDLRGYLRGEWVSERGGKSAAHRRRLPPTNLPFSRNPFFTGRVAELELLRREASEDRAAKRLSKHVITGLGGVGKTQTAVEFAYRHAADYRVILWGRAESRDELVSSFGEFARVVGLAVKAETEASFLVASVKNWLETHAEWLLILDNVEDLEMLEPFLPAASTGHLLLTSRAQVFRPLGISRTLALDALSPEESREFLLKSTHANSDDAEETKAVDELVLEVGQLPLALEQAAAFVAQNHASFRDYLRAYRAQRVTLLGEGRPRDYDRPVSTTWDMSFAAVEDLSGAAADILRLSAFLSPDAIPLELLARGAAECGPRVAGALEGVADNPLLVHRALEPLTRFSLAHVDPSSRSYTVHRLVQRLLQDRMETDSRSLWAGRALRMVNAAFPGFYPEHEQVDQWALCTTLHTHARAVTDVAQELTVQLETVGDVLDKISVFLFEAGQFAEAERVTRRCLALRLRTDGEDHWHVGRCLHGLGLIAEQQLQFAAAEDLYTRAIAIWEKACGREHHRVALARENLAILQLLRGHHDEAIELLRTSLRIFEATFGPDHPRVATTLTIISRAHYQSGRYAEAEKLLTRSLAIRRTAFGVEHRSVALVLHGLAVLRLAQGNLEESERLLAKVLAIRERTFGSAHYGVAMTLGSMAKVCQRQGRYPEARSLYHKALRTLSETVGLKNRYSAAVLEGYSDFLRAVGKPHAADRVGRARGIPRPVGDESPSGD